jgi:2-oxoacid:acceptor oxidoreductase gamma subunit (pyruvate/2-ketoisovalerate family)
MKKPDKKNVENVFVPTPMQKRAKMLKLKLYGLGGQGVVTAAQVLAHAVSIHEHKFAKTIPAYGHERRGAPVFSDVILDDEPILLNSFVYEPDIVIVFAPSIINRGIDVGKGRQKDSILILNAHEEAIVQRYKKEYDFKHIYYVCASKIALEQIGKDIPNSAMLGALAYTGIVGIESVMRSLNEIFKNERGKKNAGAAREAYKQVQKL